MAGAITPDFPSISNSIVVKISNATNLVSQQVLVRPASGGQAGPSLSPACRSAR